MLDDAELDLLEAKCLIAPLTTSTYLASDYVMALLETEAEAVAALEQVARRLDVRANFLDWSIWEHEKKRWVSPARFRDVEPLPRTLPIW